MQTTIDGERNRFESVVFRKRYIASVVATEHGLRSIDCPPKEELFALGDDGDYADDTISAMWAAWQWAVE